MQFRTQYLTQSDCYRRGGTLEPRGIVVHSTGVNQKRIGAYTAQWDRPGVQACVHGFLGLDEAGTLCYVQTLPYDRACWGCGAGPKGSYNDSHIQFEICEDMTDPDWCRATYAAALEVCAGLCRRFAIPAEAVVCHSEAHALGCASNHGDVMHWWPKLGLGMDGFRAELAARLAAAETGRIQFLDQVPESLRPETAALMAAGALRGRDGDGALDITEDMLRTMIVCKRYTDSVKGGGAAC